MEEYVPAKEAIEILGISSAQFYRWVEDGTIKKHYPTATSKHGVYDRTQLARLQTRLRRAKPAEHGLTDWLKPSDLGHFFDLEYSLYGNEAGSPLYVGALLDRNPTISRILYSQKDRRDIWGAINMIPVKEEEKIYLVLREEIKDTEIDPVRDVLAYDHPGIYNLYVSSVIIRPERRFGFIALINSVFDFWTDLAPEKQIGKIYGRVVSKDGLYLVKKLFCTPRRDLSKYAYELDWREPNPSRIVESFRACIEDRINETAKDK